MTSVPELRTVRVLDLERASLEVEEPEVRGTAAASSATTRGRNRQRLSPPVLVALALLAGAGAMALGAIAVLRADGADEKLIVETVAPGDRALRQALLLLAKPSTERVPFAGGPGRLILAVGSGGRAALVLRERTAPPAAGAFHAWVVSARGRARHAATFTGGQPVVPLSRPVAVGSSVAVTTGPPGSRVPPTGRAKLVARR